MPRNTQFYSQRKCSVVINGGSWSRTLKDFMGEEAIGWAPNSTERVQVHEGFDKSAISISSGRSGKITVLLKPTSPDVGALNKIYHLHRTNPQLLQVSIVTGVEEIIKLKNAAITVDAGKTGGPAMSGVGFTFIGEEINLDESEG